MFVELAGQLMMRRDMYAVLSENLAHQPTPNPFASPLSAPEHQCGFCALVWMLKCPCTPFNDVPCYFIIAIGEHFEDVLPQPLPTACTWRDPPTLPQVQQASVDYTR